MRHRHETGPALSASPLLVRSEAADVRRDRWLVRSLPSRSSSREGGKVAKLDLRRPCAPSSLWQPQRQIVRGLGRGPQGAVGCVPDHGVCHHLSRLPRHKSASRRGLRRCPPQRRQRRPLQNTRRGHRETAKATPSPAHSRAVQDRRRLPKRRRRRCSGSRSIGSESPPSTVVARWTGWRCHKQFHVKQQVSHRTVQATFEAVDHRSDVHRRLDRVR
jgi:hypothetical protein